jgi:hypothetical protein
MRRRYIVATIVALGLTVGGIIFVRVARASVAPLGGADTGVELPASTIWLVWASDMLVDFWWLLIPLLFVACFGIAMMFGPASRTPQK